jgi:SAM-dependent methyltransferase
MDVPRPSRLDREIQFHDDRYREESRDAAKRFYSIHRASHGCYEEMLERPTVPADVLEYGCGTGSAGFRLARVGHRVVGIDISSVAVQRAREEAARQGLESLTFEVMDAEHLELPDASIDLVCGSGILHHLDLDAAFTEIRRVLRPSGRAVFIEPLGHNLLINLFRRLTPSMRTPDEHPLVRSDLVLARRHFASVRTHHFHLTTLAAVPARRLPGFRHLLSVLEQVDRWLFRLVPPLRWQAWMVVLELERR